LRDGGTTLDSPLEERALGPLSIDIDALAESGEPPASIPFSEGGETERFERLVDPPPSVDEAAATLAGRYVAPDLGARANIALDGEALELIISGSFGINRVTLRPLSADVFAWKSNEATPPLFGVLSVGRRNGKVTGFRVDTLRTRHMRFDRAGD